MLKVISRQLKKARVRPIRPVNKVNIISIDGLAPKEGQDPNSFPFTWGDDIYGKTPEEIRWSWNPVNGDMMLGTAMRHAEQIDQYNRSRSRDKAPSGKIDFDGWLRGFYIPDRNQVLVRTYYWPTDPYDQWDEDHAQLNAEVYATFMTIMNQQFSETDMGEVDYKGNIDNDWLKGNIRNYGW